MHRAIETQPPYTRLINNESGNSANRRESKDFPQSTTNSIYRLTRDDQKDSNGFSKTKRDDELMNFFHVIAIIGLFAIELLFDIDI